jgi:two-component system, sensor histidine kinase and response regulator
METRLLRVSCGGCKLLFEWRMVTDAGIRSEAPMTTVHEHDLLHTLMANVPDAIYFKDLQSRFLRINSGLAQRFGLADPAEAIGKTDFDFFTEEHARQAYLDEQEVIRTGRPLLAREEREQWPDGRVTWASTTKLPFRDHDGVVIGTFGLSRDITHRKQTEAALHEAKEIAEASQARTRLIVDSAYDAYVAMDAEGFLIDWNRQAEVTFGWPRELVVGRPLHEVIIPLSYREEHVRGVRHFLATGEGPLLHRRIEVPALRRDGTEFPVELTISPIRLGSEWVFSAFLHDITERKRAEEELRKARDAAEAASQAKSEFLANMSHEIRTPMNAIIGMTELLLDTPQSAEQRDYLETVKKSADALLSVINDILDFSKIEAGKLELEHAPFDLRDSLGDMLNTLALRAHQKGLELACHIAPEVPETVVGDSQRLRQVLINLVGNAIKFTECGEVIVDVALEGGDDVEARLHFRVRDTGIGIPADKQSLIFEAFAQVDGSTTRRYDGTGLGLAISSRLVERMGGRIWVESEPHHGSTFHFLVRFGTHGAALERPSRSEPGRLRGLSVLVVDDNATNRFILAETLGQWHMRPTVVENATAALQALERSQQAGEPFALVLLDAHMPEVDGFTLAEQIKKHPDLAGATVMMLSSASQPIDTRRCQDLGLAAYLTKPIKQADLYRSIMAVLGSPVSKVAAPTVPPPALPCRALHLLLAEDNLVNQMLAVRLLEKQGHSVVVAGNGVEVVRMVEREPFDLVLMDVQMPEMDGFEATAAIRERERDTGRHIPILAMTAYAMKGDRERCLAAGMDSYISKPIQPRELWQAIEQLVPAALSPNSDHQGSLSSANDILDRVEALERVGGDRALFKELVEVFLADCPRLGKNIRDALAQGDAANLSRAAHTLKGAVSTFGAHPARTAAQQLELLGDKGDLTNAASLVAHLETELERLKPVLGRMTGEGTA